MRAFNACFVHLYAIYETVSENVLVNSTLFIHNINPHCGKLYMENYQTMWITNNKYVDKMWKEYMENINPTVEKIPAM
jgi:hypothetical protein